MSDLERLEVWIRENNYTVKRLAKDVGMSYDGLYQILCVRKKINAKFKHRFGQRFGWAEHDRVFPPEFTPKQESEPIHA